MAIRKPTAPADKSAAMAEMLASAGQETKFKNGNLVEGTVCAIKGDDVCVDIGYKSVGVIGIDEFATIEGEAPAVKVGDEVLLPKYGGTEVKINDKKLQLVREEDLLGVFEK